MKIKLTDLSPHEPRAIEVRGDEEWLAAIYQAYPTPAGSEAARLSGSFELTRLEGDFIQLRGKLTYAPYVNCSRCNQPLQWPIAEALEVYFQPEKPKAFAGERELAPEELDEYYLDEGELDLEILLNETVVLAIPNRTFRPGAEGGGCGVCDAGEETDCVYTTEEPQLKSDHQSDNPFQVLKGLKLDD